MVKEKERKRKKRVYRLRDVFLFMEFHRLNCPGNLRVCVYECVRGLCE